MTHLEWIGLSIVLFFAVAAVIGVSACCLSSRISREEEKRDEREWILDENQQPRLVERPKEATDEDIKM